MTTPSLDDCEWIAGAVAELAWYVAGEPPTLVAVGQHGAESTPSELAGATLVKAVLAHRPAQHGPQLVAPALGHRAAEHRGRPAITADALERFWQVDHDRHAGTNAAKWKEMAGR